MHAGLEELEHLSAERGEGRWLTDDHLTQADVTVNCVFSFLCQALDAEAGAPREFAHLRALNRRCEALPAFQAARLISWRRRADAAAGGMFYRWRITKST